MHSICKNDKKQNFNFEILKMRVRILELSLATLAGKCCFHCLPEVKLLLLLHQPNRSKKNMNNKQRLDTKQAHAPLNHLDNNYDIAQLNNATRSVAAAVKSSPCCSASLLC